MRYASSLFTIAAVCGACATSPAVGRYAPAMRPQGIEGMLVMRRGETHYVELLALTDTAYVVMTKNRVGVAPYRWVQVADFRQFGTAAFEYVPPESDRRERLRLVSRFPGGIPPAVLAVLLADAGQQAPDYLTSIRP